MFQFEKHHFHPQGLILDTFQLTNVHIMMFYTKLSTINMCWNAATEVVANIFGSTHFSNMIISIMDWTMSYLYQMQKSWNSDQKCKIRFVSIIHKYDTKTWLICITMINVSHILFIILTTTILTIHAVHYLLNCIIPMKYFYKIYWSQMTDFRTGITEF